MSNLNLGLIYKQINQLSSLNHSKVDRKTTLDISAIKCWQKRWYWGSGCFPVCQHFTM